MFLQEPENDPRLCCYLWVARGQIGNQEIGDSPTTITLYQLVYERKENLTGFGRVLKVMIGTGGGNGSRKVFKADLLSCNLRQKFKFLC